MAAASKLKNKKETDARKEKLQRDAKDRILLQINEYTKALKSAAAWHNSEDSIAYVKNKDNDQKGVNYIYEFYCYIRVVSELQHNYKCKYKPGKGKEPHKFPQAASYKKDKPRFDIYEGDNHKFQVCAGTKIKGKYSVEKDHPDISFQIASANEEQPTLDDLIMIFDAKFQLDETSKLDKGEVDKFESIVRRFQLNKLITEKISFRKEFE
ncbi:MAG TPA: hypothetical protein VNW06_02350, partial [Cytophagaceae bacterium]|nr:hypothetical protein [Cytophagaceae bacterium]